MGDIVLPRVFRDGAPELTEARQFINGYPAHAYHSDREAVSQGCLQTINQTAAHFRYEWAQPYRDNFASNPGIMRIGTMLGEKLFEPDRYGRSFVAQSFAAHPKKENQQAKHD